MFDEDSFSIDSFSPDSFAIQVTVVTRTTTGGYIGSTQSYNLSNKSEVNQLKKALKKDDEEIIEIILTLTMSNMI